MSDTLRLTFDLPLPPGDAFQLVIDELSSGCARAGLRFEPGPRGHIVEEDVVAGDVIAWDSGARMVLRWRPMPWRDDGTIEVELAVTPAASGSSVLLEHRGLLRIIGEPGELAGWLAGEVLARVLAAAAPRALGDWLTDRQARRPTGAQSRAIYADPLYHYPNFRVIVAELALQPDDHLLEIGCGGGALLEAALRSGCRASAVDHSPDMVRLAGEKNAAAVATGRLDVREARADALPFADATFSCAAMTGVLGFLPDAVKAFAEVRRVLRPGGRFVCLGSDPELRGTPAAPEPMASRLRFYEDEDLASLGRNAGFAHVEVIRRDLESFAREVGVPEEHVPLFASGPGGGARFLICRR